MSLVNFFFPLLLLLPEQKRVLDFTRQEMEEHALKTFADIGDDEELGPADWSTVNRYLTCLHIPEYEEGRAERERGRVDEEAEEEIDRCEDVRERIGLLQRWATRVLRER